MLSAFRRRKVSALAMILTVALVTGAGTSVAAFINATIVRPLPYPHAERLVGIHTMPPDGRGPQDWNALHALDIIRFRELTEDGKLIRLGYGVYGRAEISPLTKQPMLAGDGFDQVSRQVLDKLNVPWEPATAERDYNAGRSTQVPMTPRVRLPPIPARSRWRSPWRACQRFSPN